MKNGQITLFEEPVSARSSLQEERSGTFFDNMSLPIHRWFRYSAGFAAQWVEQVLKEWGTGPEHIVLDPFAGSGTVSLVCDRCAVPSMAVEAHPVVGRLLRAKLAWATPIDEFAAFVDRLLATAESTKVALAEYPLVVQRSYEASVLAYLNGLRAAWLACDDQTAAAELAWLAITAILRPTSHAGTAQWQYILPNKTKKKVLSPVQAFQQQPAVMKQDMRWMQQEAQRSLSTPLMVDAREIAGHVPRQVDAVITSPPYANNYDYADALRFEMSFWGEVNGWADIHDKARKFLIVSSSQHASRDRLELEDLVLYLPFEKIVAALAAAGIDVQFDETTPDSEFERAASQIAAAPDAIVSHLRDHLVRSSSMAIDDFFLALRNWLTRLVDTVTIIPLYGHRNEFYSIVSAVEFLDQHSIYEGSGEFHRYEVRVTFSNGEKVEAYWATKERVREFLEFVGRA